MATENEISCKLDRVCEKLNEIIEILIYQNTTDRNESKRQKKYLKSLKKVKGNQNG